MIEFLIKYFSIILLNYFLSPLVAFTMYFCFLHSIRHSITLVFEIDKNNLKKVDNILKKNSVHFDLLGETRDKEIIINDEPTFTVDKVTEFYKGWLYKYMS